MHQNHGYTKAQSKKPGYLEQYLYSCFVDENGVADVEGDFKKFVDSEKYHVHVVDKHNT